MSDVEPYFGVFWGAREQTFGQFVSQTKNFLSALQSVHAGLSTLYVLGDRANQEEPLGPNFEHLTDLALERGWDKSLPKDRFTHLDSAGRPTSESTCRTGWGLGIVNEPESVRTTERVYISLNTGLYSQWVNQNRVLLKTSDSNSPLLDPVVSEQVFRYMIDFWRAERALLTEERYRDAVRDDITRAQLGWLNYRADPNFARFLPPTIPREPYGSGVLFRIGDGRVLNETDQREVGAGLEIQSAIRKTLQ